MKHNRCNSMQTLRVRRTSPKQLCAVHWPGGDARLDLDAKEATSHDHEDEMWKRSTLSPNDDRRRARPHRVRDSYNCTSCYAGDKLASIDDENRSVEKASAAFAASCLSTTSRTSSIACGNTDDHE